jgi:hypothetical protein
MPSERLIFLHWKQIEKAIAAVLGLLFAVPALQQYESRWHL